MLISHSDFLDLAKRGYALAYSQLGKTAPHSPEDWVADPSGFGNADASTIVIHLSEMLEGCDDDTDGAEEGKALLAAYKLASIAAIMSNPPALEILAKDCDVDALISPTCMPFLDPAGFTPRDHADPADIEWEDVGDWRVGHLAWKTFSAHLVLEQENRLAKAQLKWNGEDGEKRLARLARKWG